MRNDGDTPFGTAARLWGLGFVLVALACACLPASAADLLQIYRQAQTNDPTWIGAQADRRANQERVPQARAGLLPSVDLTTEVFENNQQSKTPSTDNTNEFTSKGYGVELNQPLYNRPSRVTYEQSLAGAALADFDLSLARQDLIVRVVNGYFAVLTAREVLDFSRSEKAAVQRLLALSRRNFNVGTATLIDVHDAQAAYDLAVSQEITAANDLEVARQALRFLTGGEADELAPLASSIPLVAPDPENMEQWVTTAVAQNPSIKIREQELLQATQEIEKSRGQHQPTLDLVVGRSYNDTTSALGTSSETTNDYAGVRLRVPLYQGGGISARVRETIARRDAAVQQLEASKRQVSQQARSTYLAVINGLAQVRALEQARISNQRALESTVLGQERGLRTALDVLNNQRALYRTLRDLARARYDYLLSRVRLRSVAGAATDDDIADINRLLAGGK
ncbi:MAG: TolC family outer membrane protein [Gammaproteobacteria bacterium]|nr:TolC family outer membrane protein [Gammaproteobacteria bacterium]